MRRNRAGSIQRAMKSITIAPNSVQLVNLGLMNCYLVRENDGFTLIDTTMSGAEKNIVQAAQAHGSEIKRILLTHAHSDHIGSVDALQQRLPSAQLAASERSLPLLRQSPDLSLRPGEPAGKIKGSLPGMHSVPRHLVEDGELYGSLRAIATPGHIPGHLAFLDERDGTLFAGDALVGVGHLTVSGYAPWYFPLPNVATWNKQVAVESARKLLDFPIHRFACGHGAIREGGVDLLRKAIDGTRA